MKKPSREQIEKYITISKKKVILSMILCVILLLVCKVIPRTFPISETNIKYLIIVDLMLCMLMSIHIKFSARWEGYIAFATLLIVPGISFNFTELVAGNNIWDMKFLVVALNYVLYLSIYLLVYFIFNRIDISVSITMSFFTICALINSFVIEFRGNAVRMSDIYAIRTALNVTDGYSFVFTPQKMDIILKTVGIIFLMTHIRYKEKQIKGKVFQRIGIVAIWGCVCSFVLDKTFLEANELKPYIWELSASIKDHGVVLDFVAGIPYLSVEKPEGYSAEKADALISKENKNINSIGNVTNDLQGVYPDIIVVMNESLSDLSQLGDLETTEEYLKNFYSMKDNVIRGELSVPIFGGLTANTEFEFLTGYSNAFFPSGVMPFQNYVKKGTYNWAEHLEENGYHSIFMHPVDGNGWNRDNVYSLFGFDEEHYIEDYENCETIRYYISDSSNYKEVIKRYEDAKEKNDQVFLFNVTMQNHGGYETSGFEKTVEVVQPEGNYPKTEEYLSLIKESDRAFQELVDYFANRENPVMICMFGDHLPSVESELLDELLLTSNDSEVEKRAKKFQTPFIIYTNYEIEEKEIGNLSANYLQVLLSQAAGIPLNDYQKYLESLYEKYPVVNEFGVKDANGEWYSWEDAEKFSDIENYEKVQYRELFDQKK